MKLFVLSYQAAVLATARGIPLGTLKPMFLFEDEGGQRPTSLAQWIADALEEGRMTSVNVTESPSSLAQAISTPYEVSANRCLLAFAIKQIDPREGWQNRARSIARDSGVCLAFTVEDIVEYYQPQLVPMA